MAPHRGLEPLAVAGSSVLTLERRAKLLLLYLDGDRGRGLPFGRRASRARRGARSRPAPQDRRSTRLRHPGRAPGGRGTPTPCRTWASRHHPRASCSTSGPRAPSTSTTSFAWLRLMPLACLPAFLEEQRYGPDPPRPVVLGGGLRRPPAVPPGASHQERPPGSDLRRRAWQHLCRRIPARGGAAPPARTGSLSGEETVRLHGAVCSVLARAVPVGGAVVKRPRAVSEDRPASLRALPGGHSLGGDPHRGGRTGLLARPRPGRSALPDCAVAGRLAPGGEPRRSCASSSPGGGRTTALPASQRAQTYTSA